MGFKERGIQETWHEKRSVTTLCLLSHAKGQKGNLIILNFLTESIE